MNNYCEETIRSLGKRSSLAVLSITTFVALLGAGATLIKGVPLLWAAWIPLCFLVIPAVHFLCREFLRLQERVTELEKKLKQ